MTPPPPRKAKRSRKGKVLDSHAVERLEERCGIKVTMSEAIGLVQGAELMFKAANGDYHLVEYGNRFAVLLKNDGEVRTVLTLEHAFTNAPQGVFCFLVSTGRLIPAINIRTMFTRGLLPEGRGSDQSNYKYPKQKAQVLWDAFKWSDSH